MVSTPSAKKTLSPKPQTLNPKPPGRDSLPWSRIGLSALFCNGPLAGRDVGSGIPKLNLETVLSALLGLGFRVEGLG